MPQACFPLILLPPTWTMGIRGILSLVMLLSAISTTWVDVQGAPRPESHASSNARHRSSHSIEHDESSTRQADSSSSSSESEGSSESDSDESATTAGHQRHHSTDIKALQRELQQVKQVILNPKP